MRSDLLWVRAGTSYWTAVTGGISAKSMILATVPLNATNLVNGAVPTGAHAQLRGTIEHIGVYMGTASALNFKVAFFSSGSTPSDTIASNHYIDHEPFSAADFMELSENATEIQFQGKNDLGIPYFDKTGSKSFHVGVVASTGMFGLVASGGMVVEIGFRPDPGGG